MPDVNVLIYAHRADSDVHDFYKAWLEDAMNGRERVAVSSLVAVAFVRIISHLAFPGGPTQRDAALAVIDTLVAHPNCLILHPAERHWLLVSDLIRRARLSGSAVADAQYAAVAIEHDCTWVTRDRDFERFKAHELRCSILEPL